ncbi:MAG: tRNA (adenosine(37)-N6)-threonylcarbamoyltransferase complex ATPase subunit type 1 TsaE [Sphingobacteriaceae bacterium]|nr:tRNA (adenosine(37)-N6)-threonylcarbamoyltransferase complex ATPase subunit type 1 TsaE [Cytophagaceae bacterium]
MHQTTIQYARLDEIDEAAQAVLDFGQNRSVWLFEGEMGAGKTTFIKALCRRLGVVSTVQSPTFALVNEYVTVSGEAIYHFDFYRIKTETEALDLGVEEYFDSGNFCFVEWPSKIPSLWPPEHLNISIQENADGSRRIDLSSF